MMDYDVSLHDLVYLFTAIPTSPRSLKTDFGRKTCCVFGSENITGSSLRKVPHLAMCGIFSPLLGINIFTFCMDTTRRPLSNEPKITSIGVRMQKLWRFRIWCFCWKQGGRYYRAWSGSTAWFS